MECFKKDDSHVLQENGFSAVCIPMCVFKLEFAENAYPHTLQEKDFPPEVVCMWLFKVK